MKNMLLAAAALLLSLSANAELENANNDLQDKVTTIKEQVSSDSCKHYQHKKMAFGEKPTHKGDKKHGDAYRHHHRHHLHKHTAHSRRPQGHGMRRCQQHQKKEVTD